jgi:hypothetical protein
VENYWGSGWYTQPSFIAVLHALGRSFVKRNVKDIHFIITPKSDNHFLFTHKRKAGNRDSKQKSESKYNGGTQSGKESRPGSIMTWKTPSIF